MSSSATIPRSPETATCSFSELTPWQSPAIPDQLVLAANSKVTPAVHYPLTAHHGPNVPLTIESGYAQALTQDVPLHNPVRQFSADGGA